MIRLAISADGHINEPGDLWNENLPASLVKDGPRVEVHDGKIAMVVEGRVIRRLAPAPPGMPEGSISSLGKWSENDSASRLEALARDGVSGEVLYPTVTFFTAYSIKNRELQRAVCEVYNDWIADTFTDPHFAPACIEGRSGSRNATGPETPAQRKAQLRKNPGALADPRVWR